MRTAFLISIVLALWSACSNKAKPTPEPQVIEAAGKSADYSQMAHGEDGIVIAWWVETEPKSGKRYVYFSKSKKSNLRFDNKIIIPTSINVNAGGEFMPKFVVKPDDTYVLVFAKKNEESKAQFASSIVYSQSFDKGETWSDPKLVHSDTDPDDSHGFPEVILLPDGEVGAVWLDGRHHFEHSVIYFSKTHGQLGFGKDKQIGGPSCQCCKLDMYVDKYQTLHLVYRGLSKDNIRDIMHLISNDYGTTFSKPDRVSNDNWKIMACPHNGPSITKTDSELYIVWYTQGGEKGLYFTQSEDGSRFSSRRRLAENAKHPYISSTGTNTIVTWDEIYRTPENIYRRVKLSTINPDGEISSEYITPEGTEANMPYIFQLSDEESIISWTQKTSDGNELHFKMISEG